MKEEIMFVSSLTKDYGSDRGNFDVSFSLTEGETLGIVGENGAGKTTLIRQIMGFIKSDSGDIDLYGMDAYKDSALLKSKIAYVPGEINFPDVGTGKDFLRNYGLARGCNEENFKYADELIKRMQLDVRAYPKRMSKGMKQKTALVAAFMQKAPLIILDEPTTGLDPLMREEVLSIIEEEKKRGATIIMTSNSEEELERVCDRALLLSKGKVISQVGLSEIKNRDWRDYKIEFMKDDEYLSFLKSKYNIIKIKPEMNQCIVRINKDDLSSFFKKLSQNSLKFLTEQPYGLSKYFDSKRKEQNNA